MWVDYHRQYCNWVVLMENSDQWQENSDGWVKTMNESKEMKEKYDTYMKLQLQETNGEVLSYRKWLRREKNGS